MRQIRAADFELPLADGLITDGHRVEAVGASAESGAILGRIRQVRASLLPLCAEVMAAIDRVVILDRFGAAALSGADIALRRRIDAVLTDLAPIGKIEHLRPIIRHLRRRQAETITYRLFEAGRLFYALVSRPIFRLRLDPQRFGDDAFELCLADEQFIWTIDDDQLEEWQQLLVRCRDDLDEMCHSLVGEPARI
ncbi:hypothetical protein [Devosia sp.]|uniref:hypothetical protein n=1 Tax=Devosia sp. TaxID=1871048 RepID=UPI0035AEF500